MTGEEGAMCHVDVRNATDAQSILTLILHKFHINDDPGKYQLFIASGESGSGSHYNSVNFKSLQLVDCLMQSS